MSMFWTFKLSFHVDAMAFLQLFPKIGLNFNQFLVTLVG